MNPQDCPNRDTFRCCRGVRLKERFDMVVLFVAFGIMFGGAAAVFTVASGGSILMAVAAYSGAGIVGALAATFLLLFLGNIVNQATKWNDKKENGPVSA